MFKNWLLSTFDDLQRWRLFGLNVFRFSETLECDCKNEVKLDGFFLKLLINGLKTRPALKDEFEPVKMVVDDDVYVVVV